MNITDNKIEKISLGLAAITVSAILLKSVSLYNRHQNNKKREGNHDKKLPMIPYRFPFIGSTFEYYTNQLEFTRSNTNQYGSVFHMHIHGSVNTVVGAQDAPEVFNHPELSFVASQAKFFSNTLLHGSSKFTLPHGVIRDSLMKHLTPNLKEYSPRSFERFLKESNQMLGDLSDGPKEIPNLLPFLRSFVARYSACSFVGSRLSNDEDLINAFEHAVTDIGKEFRPGPLRVVFPTLNSLYMKLFYPYAGSIKKHRALIKGALEKELSKREEVQSSNRKDADLIQFLLDEYPHAIDNDHVETLTTVILIFIFLGVHTTTDAVTYCMYSLIKHPEYLDELLQEQYDVLDTIEAITTEQGEVILTPDHYRRMVKLDSFIREALRVRVVGIGLAHTNVSKQDIILKSGAVIKPNQEVFINMWHVHYDEANQGYDVNLDQFDGFRYVTRDNKSVTNAGHDNISFGMGKHACPGRWFATHQIKGIISHFIRHYQLKAVDTIRLSGQDKGYTGPPSGAVLFSSRVPLI